MDRRTFLKTTGAGLAGLSLAAPYVARAAAPLTLRWAHFAQEDHPANIAAKQFASRHDDPWGDVVLVSLVFVLGGRTHLPEGLFALALSQRNPGSCALALDV